MASAFEHGLESADGPAPTSEAEPDETARLRSPEIIYVINAAQRPPPKALPEFPNPSRRPEGTEPALILDIVSDVPSGADIALGRASRRDTDRFLRAISEAGDRNIECKINCAGGDGDSALAIATALLRHSYRVRARIVGRCSSAAILIALAADERSIVPDGTVLIHRAARICTREQFDALRLLSADDRAAIDASLNDSDAATTSLLMSRLGVSLDTASVWMREDRKWSAAEALQRGFVDGIIEV